MNWLLLIELPVLGALLWMAVQMTLLLGTRKRNEQFTAAIMRLGNAAQATVKEVQQTIAHDMKMRRVEQRLQGDTAAGIRATAIKILYANLGPLGLSELRRALGVHRNAPLDRLLVGRLESALYDIKKNAPKEPNEIPSEPGKRFYPETMRIPRVDKTSEDSPENLFDEPTAITKGQP